jgi:hypothetical protein
MVAEVVAQHDDLHMHAAVRINEAAVVFMADKLICGEETVTVEKRFALALERFGANPEARGNILRRWETARRVGDRIEALTGRKVTDLIRIGAPHLYRSAPHLEEVSP